MPELEAFEVLTQIEIDPPISSGLLIDNDVVIADVPIQPNHITTIDTGELSSVGDGLNWRQKTDSADIPNAGYNTIALPLIQRESGRCYVHGAVGTASVRLTADP